jgi:hypothetical protein
MVVGFRPPQSHSRSPPEPPDHFTVAIEPADGGVLRLSRDATSYLVPFTIPSPR